jgi:D-lactate dehydrogenase (cytochrome)
MDENAVKGGNKFAGLEYPETPMLLVEYAGSPVVIEEQKERVEKMAERHGMLFCRTAKDDAEYETIWDLRRNLTWSVFTLRDGSPDDFSLLTTDVGIPSSELAGFFAEARGWMADLGITMQQLAHAGDSTHHSNTPIRRGDPAELAKALDFARRLATRAIELGGTCTAEHGVGLGKRKYLELELGPEAVELMRRIKKAMDPNGILNPGHVLPDRKKE